MFKTGADYKYATIKDTVVPEYRLAPNDRFTFLISTNEGYKLIDFATMINSTSNNAGTAASNLQEFSIDRDGYAKLPILENVLMKGKTIPEAEKLLEEKYANFYKDPFIKVRVVNKRVIVFTGEGGIGITITLLNDNTTVVEALAFAGGIKSTGKAFRIKLIRGGLTNPQIFLIDLSTVESMKSGDIVLQANDIIYVEPVRNTSQGVLAQITPVVSIITALLLVYTIVKPK